LLGQSEEVAKRPGAELTGRFVPQSRGARHPDRQTEADTSAKTSSLPALSWTVCTVKLADAVHDAGGELPTVPAMTGSGDGVTT
jgi:hypothetical protein